MTGPDSEWLLWREQYRIHAKSVSQQLASLAQNLPKIEELTSKFANFSTSKDDLQTQITSLEERISSLQKSADQQIKLNESLQNENTELRRRTVHLEQELNQQDQINAMNSHAVSTLEEKQNKQKADFLNVIEAVSMMQATAKHERETQKKQLDEMRAQMEAFIAAPVQRYPVPGGREPKVSRELSHNGKQGINDRTTTRGSSQATTANESMEIDNEIESRLLDPPANSDLPGTTQLYTQYLEDSPADINHSDTHMEEQDSRSMDEYIKYGDRVITEGKATYEMQAVKRFLSGMKDKYAQEKLTEKLDNVGWTWEQAKQEINHMVERGRERRRRRRTMPAFA
ncbi:hypothetical protein ACLMJK_006826 [Lecanora helva]